MATTPILIHDLPPGRTLTADIYAAGSDTRLVTARALTAQTNRTSVYGCDITEALAGHYVCYVKNGGVVVAVRHCRTLADDTNEHDFLAYVDATLDGEEVTTDAASRTASQADVSGLALEATAQSILEGTDTTIPDLIAAIEASGASAAEIWAYTQRTLTQTAAQVVSAVSGSTITIVESCDFDAVLTGLTIPEHTKAWFSVKEKRGAAEDNALVRIEAAAGLERLAKAAAEDATQATLVLDAEAGTATIHIDGAATALLTETLPVGSYDVKVMTTDGALRCLTAGAANITRGITLATE